MGIKVHGTKVSMCTMRVLAALYEKGIDFELVNVDMATGEHKKPPYLSLNVCVSTCHTLSCSLKFVRHKLLVHISNAFFCVKINYVLLSILLIVY